MIFYLARDEQGYRHLLTREVDAKKMDKEYTQLDIATDKPTLQAALQELLTEADEAQMNSGVTEVEVTKVVEKSVDLTQHSNKCPACHRYLTATEDGAIKLAAGEDMSLVESFIETAPDWAVERIGAAVRRRENDG